MTIRVGRAAKRAATALLPGYAYVPRLHAYRDLASGRTIARKAILGKLEDQIVVRERELASLVERFTSADLNGSVYARTADVLLKRQALQQAALSAGGWDRLTASDYGRVGQMLGVQYRSNAKLVADYYAGLVSPAQAMQRIHMAMGNVRMVGMQIDLAHRPAAAAGMARIEMRTLDANVENCEQCLVTGTLVLCERGWKPIETIRVGDKVMTLEGWREVENTGSRLANQLVYIATADMALICTPEHPILTDSGWRLAGQLITGQQVMTIQGGSDRLHGQVTFPYSLDSKAVGFQASSFGDVCFAPRPLLFAKRLEPGMSMPIIPINLYNKSTNPEIAGILINNELPLVRYIQGSQEKCGQLLGLSRPFACTGDSALEKTGLIIIQRSKALLASHFAKGVRMVFSSIGARRRVMDNVIIGMLAKAYAKCGRVANNLSSRHLQKTRAFMGALSRIILTNDVILFNRPLMISQTGATNLRSLSNKFLAADGAQGLRAGRATAFAKSHFTKLDRSTFAKIMGFIAVSTERMVRLFSATGTFHGSLPARVYNLSVVSAEHYIANGIFVHNCILYHSMGWQLEGELPRPGEDAVCLTNCRCSIENREVPAGELDAWLGTRH